MYAGEIRLMNLKQEELKAILQLYLENQVVLEDQLVFQIITIQLKLFKEQIHKLL